MQGLQKKPLHLLTLNSHIFTVCLKGFESVAFVCASVVLGSAK